jgi:hypothetical protein
VRFWETSGILVAASPQAYIVSAKRRNHGRCRI